MLEFVHAAYDYLSITCQKYRLWMNDAAVSVTALKVTDDSVLGDDAKSNDLLLTSLLRDLILSVQKVIVRYRSNAAKTEQNEGQ